MDARGATHCYVNRTRNTSPSSFKQIRNPGWADIFQTLKYIDISNSWIHTKLSCIIENKKWGQCQDMYWRRSCGDRGYEQGPKTWQNLHKSEASGDWAPKWSAPSRICREGSEAHLCGANCGHLHTHHDSGPKSNMGTAKLYIRRRDETHRLTQLRSSRCALPFSSP